MSEKIFLEKYNKLNKSQKEAVDTIDGPVIVVAGPGTGKTTILTLRIANILRQTDTPPESILALTFTDAGVVSMRKKLIEILGPIAYQIKITTFHTFTNELIQNNPDIFQELVSFNSAAEVDQLKIIQDLLDELDFSEIKPIGDPYKYVRDIKTYISHLKKENVTSAEYKKIIDNNLKEFNSDENNFNKKTGKLKTALVSHLNKLNRSSYLSDFYEKYQQELKNQKLYDYDDMILSVIHKFENNRDFLLEQQERFLYILADEHQDANETQNKILELLSDFHENPNLFIVGDEKQAIFRFQGASLDNFLYFQNKHANTKLIELDQNYRSHQGILDSAHSLIDYNFPIERKQFNTFLKSNNDFSENKINVVEYFDESSENYLIVEEIEKLINRGESPDEIAVIYRTNKESYEIAKFLEKKNVPFFIKSNQNILEQEDVNKIRIFLTTILDLTNNQNLAKVLIYDFLKNDPVDIHKILSFQNKNSEKTLIEIVEDKNLLNDLNIKQIDLLLEKVNLLKEFSVNVVSNSANKVFEDVLYKTGLIQHILKDESSLERLAAINKMFNELKNKTLLNSNYTISDFLNHLSMIESYNTGLTGNISPIDSGVNLMTAHSSKGLEFKYVFIPHSTSKNWGNGRRTVSFYFPNKELDKEIQTQDERRLFYVALTRAKEKVFISYANKNLDGKDNLPTQFLSEIKAELINKEENISNNIKDIYTLIAKPQNNKMDLHDKEYISNLFLSRPLSVSALNNYIECPWKYFYLNLIRIPKDQSDIQKNGQAVHYALKIFFNEFDKNSLKPDFEYLFEYYQQALNQSGINSKLKEEYLVKYKNNLQEYYNQLPEKIDFKTLTEYTIQDIELEINSKNKINLKGQLDRVDFLSDGHVRVVDYKTTKPKSLNHIMGKNENSNSNYYRQLVFYKLLIDEHYKKNWTMQEGEIIFMDKQDESAKIKSLVLKITDEEVKELKKEIIEFSEDILNFNFLDKKCEDDNCEYCKFGLPN